MDGTLLEFTGAKSGSFKIRGPSGQTYRVQQGRRFYVRNDDLGHFKGLQGYREAAVVEQVEDISPPLVATGVAVVAPSAPPEPKVAQCIKKTKSGARCSRDAVDGRYCKQHKEAAAA